MHRTGQLLRLKWDCFLLGEQFPMPGRLRKGPFPLNPSPPTVSTPRFSLGSLRAIWAFWRLFKPRIHRLFFWCHVPVLTPLLLSFSSRLITGRGWGCLQTQFWLPHRLAVPVPPLQKLQSLCRSYNWGDGCSFGASIQAGWLRQGEGP